MQNKTLLIVISAAVIVLLGAGGIFLYSKNKIASTPNKTISSVSPAQKENSSEGSFKDIFSNSGNKMCTFYTKGEKEETKGTVYSSNDKAYGEIQLISSSKTQKTFFIRNGDVFYMWGDSLPTGLKMTVSVDEMVNKMSGNQPTFAPNQKVTFKCSDWTVDSKKFTPPADVKFTDLSSMIKKTGATGTPTTTAGSSSQCSICNSLTGAAKTACLTQFSCNK